MKVFKDLTGYQFGRLTAIGLGPRIKGRERQWVCKCSCGATKIVASGNLIAGSTRSCGCLKKEVSSMTVKVMNARQKGTRRPSVTKPGAAFRSLFYRYKKDAARRGHLFSLPIDVFKQLTSSPCFYCGHQPAHTIKAWSGEVYTYNGIDRRHNNFGYHEGNCVSCCEKCNRFKGRLGADEFVDLAMNVANYSVIGVSA